MEEADGLSAAQMQTIARQFNLSETIFVQAPGDPAHTAKVRIFFPTAEIPFAGHPTIGCAIHLAGDDAALVTLEEVAGLVPVTLTRDGPTVQAEFTAPKLPRALPATPNRATMAAALGLTEQDLAPTPLGNFEGGPHFLYVELTDLDALARAQIREPAFTENARDRRRHRRDLRLCPNRAGLHTGAHVRPDRRHPGGSCHPARPRRSFRASFFATGALTDGTSVWTVRQGVEMGRPLRPAPVRRRFRLAPLRRSAWPAAAVKIAEGRIRIPDA